ATVRRRARGQDDRGLFGAESARRAVQSVERVRTSRGGPDQARVTADPRPAVGVPVLRGPRLGAGCTALRTLAGASGRIRAAAAGTRIVRLVEKECGPGREGDFDMTMTGAQILWECLVREGVTDVFGYPGGAILPAYDAMLRYPIRHVLVRHEQG